MEHYKLLKLLDKYLIENDLTDDFLQYCVEELNEDEDEIAYELENL